jgi:hypothetical protein
MSRPGFLLIMFSLAGIFVMFVAVCVHGYGITGQPSLVILAVMIALQLTYLFGFIRYAGNKGYSGWLGFWLCFGSIPGLIALLLLPDRNRY